MGCFSVFPCFTTSKHRKSATSSSFVYRGNDKNRVVTSPTQESSNLGYFLRDNSEDHLVNNSDNKAVTIVLDVDTNADISIEKDEILSVESNKDPETNVKEESGKLVLLGQSENGKDKRENEDEKQIGKLGHLVQIMNEKEKKKEKHQNVEVHVEYEHQKERNKELEEENGVFHEEIMNENKIEKEKKEGNQSSGVQEVLQNQRDAQKQTKTVENKHEVQKQAFSDSSVSSYISYPPMHRYHNCVITEDEDQVLVQEDSSESLFSLSINPRRQSKSCPVEVNDDKEVNSPLKSSCSPELNAKSIGFSPNGSDHNQSVDSSLNPIENLAQWKTLKTRPMPTPNHDQEKENVYLEQEKTHIITLCDDPVFKVSDRKGKLKTDSAVNTSLSSWLIEPKKTPTVSKTESQFSTGDSYPCSDGATSWKSIEDRPILGAWTIDEVKQVSARSSPRKSPCRNPDETPIIGTVGSYWSHTGLAATDSSSSCSSPLRMSGKSRRCREKKASSCHSSPLKRRLGRALDE